MENCELAKCFILYVSYSRTTVYVYSCKTSDKAVFMGIGESFYIWSPTEYENQYMKSQQILREKGPPKLILKKN